MQNGVQATDKLVSVIVPNFNYGRYLEDCITSILGQTYRQIELIVVDDGSSDESLEVIESFSNQVKLLTQKNQGVNSARNLGILNASGSLIALCDSDDYWAPKKIEKQISLLVNDPSLVLVGSSIRYFSSERPEIKTIQVPKQGDLSKLYGRNPGVAWIPNAPSSSLFHKPAALSIGLFDESLRGNAEDWEFFARLSKLGNFVAINEPLVNVRIHTSSRSQIELLKWYKDNRKALSAFNSKNSYLNKIDYIHARLSLEFTTIKSLFKHLQVRDLPLYLRTLFTKL